jgi:hypothetical protein
MELFGITMEWWQWWATAAFFIYGFRELHNLYKALKSGKRE